MPPDAEHADTIVFAQLIERKIHLVGNAKPIEAKAQIVEDLADSAWTRLAVYDSPNDRPNVPIPLQPSVPLGLSPEVKANAAHPGHRPVYELGNPR
jgi:hypothetical protein